MSQQPYGITNFCDDIRFETSGKLTLVGCYGADMNFEKPAPGSLNGFSMLVSLMVPESIRFEAVKIQVVKEEGPKEDILFEAGVELDANDVQRAMDDARELVGAERFAAMRFPIQLGPLTMNDSGCIRVRAFLDEAFEVKLGRLNIRFPASESVEEAIAQ